MNNILSTREIARAMAQISYRRQFHRGRWRVVWWPACNLFPVRIGYTVADRRTVIRAATKVKRPQYNQAEWDEIVMLLPAVATYREFEDACAESKEVLRARFDNLDLIGGGGT